MVASLFACMLLHKNQCLPYLIKKSNQQSPKEREALLDDIHKILGTLSLADSKENVQHNIHKTKRNRVNKLVKVLPQFI